MPLAALLPDRFQYLGLLGVCLLVTLPLEFVFKHPVWRRPRRLLRALRPPLVLFSILDILAIHRSLWRYSARYTTGWDLPLRFPIEEFAFFLVVPVCGLLTWAAVRSVLDPSDDDR